LEAKMQTTVRKGTVLPGRKHRLKKDLVVGVTQRDGFAVNAPPERPDMFLGSGPTVTLAIDDLLGDLLFIAQHGAAFGRREETINFASEHVESIGDTDVKRTD
jgi:hypothetical protein